MTIRRNRKWIILLKLRQILLLLRFKITTYRSGAVSCSSFHDGCVALSDDWPRLIDALHSDLLAVNQQPYLAALYAQSQLVPLSVKQFLQPLESPHHLCPLWTSVKKVQRLSIRVKTQAGLFSSFWVTDLPKVPGRLSSVIVHFKCCDNGVFSGKSIWIHITVQKDWD